MENQTRTTLLIALVALLAGFVGSALWSYSPLGKARVQQIMLDHPEILPQMARNYQEQEMKARLAEIAPEALRPFPGAVIGNPDGARTLVEFSDYNCTYCRASQSDLERLVAQHDDLKIVVREWPIFEGSELAARMALAAAMQGKYAAFHEAMYRHAPVSEESVARAATEAGLDLERARRDSLSPAVSKELENNMQLARTLGFTGTPSFIVGDRAFEGMVGFDALDEAVRAIGN